MQECLGALLDGEASRAEQLALRPHLSTCESCRRAMAELTSLRASLQHVYRATLATAPPVPDQLRHSRIARPVRFGLFAGMAAALALVAFLLIPQSRLDASPLATLQRAASAYRALDDVELWVSAESQVINLIERLANQTDSHDESTVTRVFLRSPGHLLIQQAVDPRAPLASNERVQGWDGNVAWSYDPKEAVVHLRRQPSFEWSISQDGRERAGDLDVMQFLSWGFVRELTEVSDSLAIEERTGPSDERAGRRVMRLLPKRAADQDGVMKKLFWARAEITIDAAHDRIEKLIVDASFAGVSLLRFTAEVARCNQRLPAAFFEYHSHVPAGTPVRED
jgi:hypothetical protein